MDSYFEPQYDQLRAQHSKIKDGATQVQSLISSIRVVTSITDYHSTRLQLRNSFEELETFVNDYCSALRRLRRQVERMSSNTPDQVESKETELKLYEDLMEDNNEGIDYDAVSLTESFLPSISTRVDRAIDSSFKDVKLMVDSMSSHQSNSNQPPPIQIGISSDSHHSPSIPTVNESILTVLNAVTTAMNNLSNSTNVPYKPITLTPFDGESTQWESFYRQYMETIHCQSNLSNHAKLLYLRESLTGIALETVQFIPVGNDHLQETIHRLKSVFGQSKRTNTMIINQFLSIRPKSPSFEDQLDCTRQLMSKVFQLNDKSIVDNFTLIHQIAGTIHSNHVKSMYQLEPDTMMQALEHIESDLRERIEIRNLQSTFRPNRSDNSHLKSSSHVVEKSHDSPSKPNQSSFKPQCVYCGKHDFSNCTSITSISERKTILKEKKLCFKCLSSQHLFHQCKKKCMQCSKPHHKSICDSQSSSSNRNQSNLAATVTSNDQTYSMPRLYTATTSIQNPLNCRTTPVQVLLDHGSMVSLISRSLTEELNLKPHSSVPMTIRGCGGIPTGGSTHDVVTVNLVTTNGLLPINALVLDSPITHPMDHNPLSEEDHSIVKSICEGDYPHLAQHATVTPDLLISISSTQSILNGSTISNLPSGYKLVKSILGPIIIGEPHSNKQFHHKSIHNPVVMTGVIAESTDQSTWSKLDSCSSFLPVMRPSTKPSNESNRPQSESPVQFHSSITANSGSIADDPKHDPMAIDTATASFNYDIGSFEYSILTDNPIPIKGTTPKKKPSVSIPHQPASVSNSISSPC